MGRRGHDRMVVGILQVLQFPPPIKLNLEKLFTHLPTHVYFKHYPAVKKIYLYLSGHIRNIPTITKYQFHQTVYC
jgi:hypothetical protein